VPKISKLRPFREIIDVNFEKHTKYINTVCVKIQEFLNAKAGRVYPLLGLDINPEMFSLRTPETKHC